MEYQCTITMNANGSTRHTFPDKSSKKYIKPKQATIGYIEELSSKILYDILK